MSLAQIAATPSDDQELSAWSLSHADHHTNLILAANRRQIAAHATVTRFSSFILDPFDPENLSGWLNNHQAMHNELNQALGISGYDLQELDWQDEGSVADWMAKNFDEHNRIGTFLNVG